MPQRPRITIVGLGLIGGSLGLALRRRRLATAVVGCSRRASSVRAAKRRGAIDWGTTDVRTAVAHADLVVLAGPVDTIPAQAKRCARFMRPGAVLTDVGSTKAAIVRSLERSLPRGIAFVGAHPIAGSEQRGLPAARADLFDGALCILTRTPRTPARAFQAVQRLWRPLAGRVLTMSPARHDAALAAVSHLPHAVACCLMQAVPSHVLPQMPQSFLDMTRIANSPPDLWDDIFLTNRTALLQQMARFEVLWRRLRAQLRRGDRAAVQALLAAAQRRRHALQDS